MKKYEGFTRAMIFNRPPVLPKIFNELGFSVPKEYEEPLKKAAKLYREEGSVAATALASAAASAAPSTLAPAKAAVPVPGLPPIAKPIYKQPKTDVFGKPLKASGVLPTNRAALVDMARVAYANSGNPENILGGYGKPPNPYGLTLEEMNNVLRVTSPDYYPGTPPAKGGSRRRPKTSKRKTRKAKAKATLRDIAKSFKAVWNSHAKNRPN